MWTWVANLSESQLCLQFSWEYFSNLLVSANIWDKKFSLHFPGKVGLLLVHLYTEDTAFGIQLSAGIGVFLLLDSINFFSCVLCKM